MATASQTPRARDHAVAKAENDRHVVARDLLSRNRDQAERELERLQAEKQELSEQRGTALLAAASDPSQRPKADKLRARIEEIDRQIKDSQDFHAAAFQRTIELSEAHSKVHQVYQQSRRDLVREPCELVLERIDALFAELTSAWLEAATEARSLNQQGDVYGENELRWIQGHVFLPHVATEGPYAVQFPDRSAPYR